MPWHDLETAGYHSVCKDCYEGLIAAEVLFEQGYEPIALGYDGLPASQKEEDEAKVTYHDVQLGEGPILNQVININQTPMSPKDLEDMKKALLEHYKVQVAVDPATGPDKTILTLVTPDGQRFRM